MILVIMLSAQSCTFVKIDKNPDIEVSVNGKEYSGSSIKGSSSMVEKTFDFTEVRSLLLEGSGDVQIVHGNTPSLSVKVPENLAEYLKVGITDGELEISLDHLHRYRDADLDIHLAVPMIESVEIDGAGMIRLKDMGLLDFEAVIDGAGSIYLNNVAAGALDLSVDGAGHITSDDLDCTSINAEIDGTGEITLNGKAASADLNVDGIGTIDIRNFNCPNANCHRDGIVKIKR